MLKYVKVSTKEVERSLFIDDLIGLGHFTDLQNQEAGKTFSSRRPLLRRSTRRGEPRCSNYFSLLYIYLIRDPRLWC